MPTISMFYGILIRMYVLDTKQHHLPHIHVEYAEFEAIYSLVDGAVLDGHLPARQHKLVVAWMELHHDELHADWKLASAGQAPYKIAPLI